MFRSAVVITTLSSALAGGNGRGQRPPMGWRSWNFYAGNIDQNKMMKQMAAAANRTRLVDGKLTSLADLGYNDIGLDDNWQDCGSYGPDNYTYHNGTQGSPLVNHARFPDMKAMTDYAHSLNLTAGWYGNNCICNDHCATDACYAEDVAATIAYGFDSTKLDGCGAELDLGKWWALFGTSGKDIMVENCHWGNTLPNSTWCPWTYYRSSGDIKPFWPSIMHNLATVYPLAEQNLSTPQCWAYPDMLEVGHIPLSFTESKTHFAAWAIVSSPLILGFDMSDEVLVDELWPIIANPETLEVSQSYAGFSGSRFANGTGWVALYKPVDADRTAVLVINDSLEPRDLAVTFKDVPGLPCAQSQGGSAGAAAAGCAVRDIYARSDVGVFQAAYAVNGVPRRDSVFVMLSSPAQRPS